jgi:hypothetical protein
MIGRIMQYILGRFWPHSTDVDMEVHQVADIPPEDREKVEETENRMRQEMVRAQTEYLRLRDRYGSGRGIQ